jgi:hypothetical protein
MSRQKRTILASVVASLAVLGSQAGAVLLGTSAGYQYIAGSEGYWGHDFSFSGNARLDGGWYPLARLGLVSDSAYQWITAPSLGLEKGFPGLGRGRAVYTFSYGRLRDSQLSGATNSLELGWFRMLSPRLSGDAAYRLTSGKLFSGITRIIDVDSGGASDMLGSSVYHQLLLSAGWLPELDNFTLRLDGGVSAAAGGGGQTALGESLMASAPVAGGFWADVNMNLIQDSVGPGRLYAGLGISWSFAGQLNNEGGGK